MVSKIMQKAKEQMKKEQDAQREVLRREKYKRENNIKNHKIVIDWVEEVIGQLLEDFPKWSLEIDRENIPCEFNLKDKKGTRGKILLTGKTYMSSYYERDYFGDTNFGDTYLVETWGIEIFDFFNDKKRSWRVCSYVENNYVEANAAKYLEEDLAKWLKDRKLVK